jgi:hypothetical protein
MNYSSIGDISIAEAQRRCIMRLRYWALCHAHYSRQWRHILFHPSFEECPDAQVLDLQEDAWTSRPIRTYTDDELDLLDASR